MFGDVADPERYDDGVTEDVLDHSVKASSVLDSSLSKALKAASTSASSAMEFSSEYV